MILAPASSSRHAAGGILLALAAVWGCRAPDPHAELALSDLEAHWAVESPVGETQYIAPVVRFVVRNQGQRSHRSIQATAAFKRQGDSETWSSAWQRVSPVDDKPLAPGETRLVVLKPEGEGRYHSTGPPEAMFQHPNFKDVRVEVFLQVGPSPWTKFASVDVERHLGPRSAAAAKP